MTHKSSYYPWIATVETIFTFKILPTLGPTYETHLPLVE